MTSIQAGGRPPYVEFETRSTEDRAKSHEIGSKQYREEDYVIVRQAGAKDTMERNAQEWLTSIQFNPNYDPMWVQRFRAMYQQFKAGQTITPDGTHVRMWPAASKAEVDTLIAAQILTVEDLAVANEDALRRVGMGARALQDKAKAYLQAGSDIGKTAEELADLRQKVSYKDEVIEQMQAQIKELASRIPKPSAKQAVKEELDEFLAA